MYKIITIFLALFAVSSMALGNEIIIKRQKIYWEQTAPIIDYYKKLNLIKEINGLGTISEISERIFKGIN